MYLEGRLDDIILKMYSIENRMVKNHSAIKNSLPYFIRNGATLSRSTINTLNKIAINNATSKVLPSEVSDPKIISCILNRQVVVDLPIILPIKDNYFQKYKFSGIRIFQRSQGQTKQNHTLLDQPHQIVLIAVLVQ